MNGKTLLIALLFVAAAGGGYYVLKMDSGATSEDPPAPRVDTSDAGQPTEEPKIEARQATGEITVDPDKVPREKRVMTPDGKWYALLNDATNVRDFREAWSSEVPWSPIVDITRDKQGQDWWVHADGTVSTSMMLWRKDLGRSDGMLQVAHPIAPLPMKEEEFGSVGPIRPGQEGR